MNHFNDSPIEISEDDYFGINEFTKTLAKGISDINNPVGTVIALHGPWGSGKSSAVNLVKNHLKDSDQEIQIVNFACWWYRGEEALALAFLQNLNSAFTLKFGDKVKEFIPKMAKNLLQAGPIIASAVAVATTGKPWSGLIKLPFDFISRFFPDGDSLECVFSKLTEFLLSQDTRFLVIIDDIDRLSPEEAIAVFRIVKSVGRLPNVQYLLVFDRTLAEKNAAQLFPSEGPHFLEKIIQVSLELPYPLKSDLNNVALSNLHRICGPIDEADLQHLMNLYYDIIAPSIETPRDIARYNASLSLIWPAISKEVCIGDFLAVEMLRLKHPLLHRNIAKNKNVLCDNRSEEKTDENIINSRLLKDISNDEKDFAKRCFDRLFPNWQSRKYVGGFEQSWSQNKMICSKMHFDTYFRLSISDHNMSGELLKELISRANDKAFVQAVFRNAAATRRKDGTSLIPVYLDELSTQSSKINASDSIAILSALFEIHDDIDLEIDTANGFMSLATTSRRYLWLTSSLLFNRFTIEERSAKIMEMCKNWPIGWLAEFTRSCLASYEKIQNNPDKLHDPLVTEGCANELGRKTLQNIIEYSKSNEMIAHKDLGSLIHMWYRLDASEPKQVKVWANNQLKVDKNAVLIAKTFTSEAWGHGTDANGLDDRVSMRQFSVDVDKDSTYIDLDLLAVQIQSIVDSGELSDDLLQIGKNFLVGIHNSKNDIF